MNIIDTVLAILVIGIVLLETKRGFGKVIFDFLALLIAVRGVALLAPHVARAVHIAGDAPANEALWYALLFAVFGGILLYIGKLVYESTLISLETLDPLLGGVFGFGVAVIVGHAITRALAISANVAGAPPEVLASSTLGMEFYDFVTYHRIIEFLSALPD